MNRGTTLSRAKMAGRVSSPPPLLPHFHTPHECRPNPFSLLRWTHEHMNTQEAVFTRSVSRPGTFERTDATGVVNEHWNGRGRGHVCSWASSATSFSWHLMQEMSKTKGKWSPRHRTLPFFRYGTTINEGPAEMFPYSAYLHQLHASQAGLCVQDRRRT